MDDFRTQGTVNKKARFKKIQNIRFLMERYYVFSAIISFFQVSSIDLTFSNRFSAR